MKKIFWVILIIWFLFPKMVLANGAGLPPFFEVNGKMSIPNPLQIYGITASTFLIPQDFAAENYIVNQTINFKIEQDQLVSVIPEQYLKTTQYSWDFGDGTSAEGLTNTHTYFNIGSYILILTINIYTPGTQIPTKFVDSFLINILPDKSYDKLPQAVIKINGQGVKGDSSLTRVTPVNFNDTINFDGSDSTDPNSPITQYLWNFGDGQTSDKSVTSYQYGTQRFVTVVLRIKDQNGFFSDAFVGLDNNPNIKSINQSGNSQPSNGDLPLQYIFLAGAGLSFLGLIFVLKKSGK